MRTASLLAVVPAVILLACFGTEQPEDAAVATTNDVASVRAEIDRSNQRMSDLVSRAAWDSIGTLYTSDAMVLAPNAPALEGDSIKAFWRTGEAMGIKSLRLETTDVEVSGDLAVETGTYELGMQPAGGAAATDRGKYLVVWKRQDDGTWKIHRDIFNTSMPAPQGQ